MGPEGAPFPFSLSVCVSLDNLFASLCLSFLNRLHRNHSSIDAKPIVRIKQVSRECGAQNGAAIPQEVAELWQRSRCQY